MGGDGCWRFFCGGVEFFYVVDCVDYLLGVFFVLFGDGYVYWVSSGGGNGC